MVYEVLWFEYEMSPTVLGFEHWTASLGEGLRVLPCWREYVMERALRVKVLCYFQFVLSASCLPLTI